MAQIILDHISKRFVADGRNVDALKDISLEIEKGEIYGIIGMSGAGKSTLVRCLNYLEKPTDGKVFIEGNELGSLKERQLREKRRSIAMIFQHFNLLMQKTVLDNIVFPLLIQGEKKSAARQRAKELLQVVGLTEKEKDYPSQLSGGQKQRVAIARALASNPHILLCDEATSALDPQTTQSILRLLRQINQEYGITIVMITHQMDVIREICEKVAIIEQGRVVESGYVEAIFNHPKSDAGRRLIIGDAAAGSQLGAGQPEEGQLEKPEERNRMETEVIFRIVFTENSAFEPVIANMILHIGEPINILRADTKNVNGIAKGEMLLGIPEHRRREIENYLTEKGLEVEEVDRHVQ
ncbi:methionine ABC transporter ATP-binding protein [Hespellia stercorisuis]|uniref:D-methionine transport system ATP-binding protein n=1 Tax=Hespellia stercorisuis DSM 15480 TaxID=1121950 RepID=A0A1M6QWJ6_9FIRM|nr:ATP-binding cassette domain-containing protein [Hespellia stercorisuis]SHK24493.1 D-methionine transport system ATP-binding protein [Hespellia stercorisuis DSM 15480]